MHDRLPPKRGDGRHVVLDARHSGKEWPCTYAGPCKTACLGCPHVGKAAVGIQHSVCTFCVGAGYVMIRDGEDTMDCPRCNGTGHR